MKNEKKKLYGGFEVELVHGIEDDHGNFIEVLVWYLGEILESINVIRKFATNTEAIAYVTNIAIPSFIIGADGGNGEIRDIEFIKSKFAQEKLVDRMLYDFRSVINYGYGIDLLVMLPKYGYFMPYGDDQVITKEYQAFCKYINKINTIMIRKLKEVMFDADRNISNTHNHTLPSKHEHANTVIATRFSITSGYKMLHAVEVFTRPIDRDYLEFVELGPLKKKNPELHNRLIPMSEQMNPLKETIKDAYEKSGFGEVGESFLSQMEVDEDEYYDYWSKQKPEAYKKWIVKYRANIKKEDLPNF